MDFLNQAFAQVGDLFRSMTPGARITAGLLLAVVVVSLGYLFTAQVSGPDTDLMNGVPVASAYIPAMEAAFDQAGLKNYEIRGTQIRVPRGQKSAYMAALADAKALPPNIHKVFDDALEGTGPFTTTKEREERLKIAKEKKLGLILSLMRGIEAAHVMYDSQRKPGFRQESVSTATASVQAEAGEHLDQAQVSAIRHLVAGAIAGLKPESVNVADLNGGQIHYGGNATEGGNALDDAYIGRKQFYERHYQTNILDALTYIPGIKVTTNVELDPQRISRSESVKYDPKATALFEKDESSTATREGNGVAGRPGFPAQQPNTATALAGSRTTGTKEDEEETRREAISVTNTEHQQTETVGLTPKRVTASIGIPSSYFEKLWREQNPPADGAEPQPPTQQDLQNVLAQETPAIQQYVAKVLPPPPDAVDPTELVTVKMFQDIQAAAIPKPGMSETAVTWFGEYWSTLGMIGVALFSLMMLRSMVRASPVRPGAPGRMGVYAEEEEEETVEEAALNRLGRFGGSGRSLRDELADLVQEDPDTAANILKGWIGNAG